MSYRAVHRKGQTTLDMGPTFDPHEHMRKDFSTKHYCHVVNILDVCIGCGATLGMIQAGAVPDQIACLGPGSAYGCGTAGAQHNHSTAPAPTQWQWAPGISGTQPIPPGGLTPTTIANEALKSIGKKPDEPAKQDKLIAESAKPTTGVDWDAFKNFGRGL